MDLIKRGREITQTIRNVSRLKEIITVMAVNGLDEFIIKSGLHKFVPNFVFPKSRISKAIDEVANSSWAAAVGYRLRRSFEDLGPSFVKIGQLLSTREDIFPEEFINEMKVLRDQAKGIDFSEVKAIIENSLGKSVEEIFNTINEKPIGTASIGVVYKAELKDGTPVVIKVRRPGIKKTIQIDMSIVEFMVGRMEKVSEEFRLLGVSRIVRDFGSGLARELDFRVEALNGSKLKENLKVLDKESVFHIPHVYDEFTSEEVLIMEFLNGTPFSNSEKIKPNIDIVQDRLEYGINIFIKTLLKDGFFHADLHGGNFFLLDENKIGLIDFGLVGHLSKKGRSSLIVILYSLLSNNYENLIYEFLDVAEYEEIPDIDALIRDTKETLSPFVGLTVAQIDMTQLFNKVVTNLLKHKIYLPTDWFVVFRAMITLDGVGKSLGIDIDIFTIIDKNLNDVVRDVYSKESLLEDSLLTGRDILNSVRMLPRHLRWFTKEISKNNYAIGLNLTGHEPSISMVKNAIIFFGHAFMSGLFFIGGVMVIGDNSIGMWKNISYFSIFFWLLSVVLFFLGRRALKAKI